MIKYKKVNSQTFLAILLKKNCMHKKNENESLQNC